MGGISVTAVAASHAPVLLAAPHRHHATTARIRKRSRFIPPAATKSSSSLRLSLTTTTTKSLPAAPKYTDTKLINAAALACFGGPKRNNRSRAGVASAYMEEYQVSYPPANYKPRQKPEWWWRALSSAPYLMALQMSDAAFYFQPLIDRYDQFQFLSYYIPGAIKRLPHWFLIVYNFGVYMGIVRNRQQWPHFFRYHVMLALLLENLLQILWIGTNFMPLLHYNGSFAMPYWPIVATVFISVLVYCVSCALRGCYVSFPFISDAAYVHTPYLKGDH